MPPRRLLSLLCLLAALALLANAAALPLAPAPRVQTPDLTFAAAQGVTLGRCVTVVWDVPAAAGVWVNGTQRDPSGGAEVCIDRSFARPQLYARLADGGERFYELDVTSLLYTGGTALAFGAQWVGAAALLAAAFALARRPSLRQEPPAKQAFTRGELVVCGTLWGIYLALCVHLALTTPEVSFPAEFYVTPESIAQAWRYPVRPFTVPLLYKLLDNDTARIEAAQWAAAVLGWTALASGAAALTQRRVLRVGAFALLLALSLSRDVYFWNSMLLSEGLSTSLWALLVGGVLWALRLRHVRIPAAARVAVLVAAGVVTVLWSFTRDANSYVVLACGGLLALRALVLALRRRFRPALLPLALAVGCAALFLFQSANADSALRWRWPLMNVIARRILPFPQETAFFAARGMPTTPDVLRFAGQFAWTYPLDPLEPWLTRDGRRTYLAYLLSDPLATVTSPFRQWETLLLFDEPLIAIDSGITALPGWQTLLTGAVYPEGLGLVLFGGGGLLAGGIWLWRARARDERLLPVLALALLCYPVAFIVWYGDGFAVERHALPAALQARMVVWLCLLWAADYR